MNKHLLPIIRRFFPRADTGPSTETNQRPAETLRTNPRFRHCLRVMAPELPNYRALTVDVSALGLCLETFSPVSIGDRFDMKLDIGVFPISLQGEVRSCREVANGIFHVGVCVRESRPHGLHALALYLEQEHRVSEPPRVAV
jgi:PilZ domain